MKPENIHELFSVSVLIVEDHDSTREILARLLQRRGFMVSCASTLGNARAALREKRFDVLLSDIGLPDGSGYELMAEARACTHTVGIAMSGYGMEEDINRALNAGFHLQMTKPVTIAALEKALAIAQDTLVRKRAGVQDTEDNESGEEAV